MSAFDPDSLLDEAIQATKPEAIFACPSGHTTSIRADEAVDEHRRWYFCATCRNGSRFIGPRRDLR